nr:hypothetical protein CFP56_23923 [Quercus suber]
MSRRLASQHRAARRTSSSAVFAAAGSAQVRRSLKTARAGWDADKMPYRGLFANGYLAPLDTGEERLDVPQCIPPQQS